MRSAWDFAVVAIIATVLIIFLSYNMVVAYLAHPNPWGGAGTYVLVLAGLLLLWWLFGKAVPTGLELARKTVGKLEEEEGGRRSVLTLVWVLFAAAVILVLAVAAGPVL